MLNTVAGSPQNRTFHLGQEAESPLARRHFRLTPSPKLASFAKAAWVGAFGWHTPKTTVIGREKKQISISNSSASYQSWFPRNSTLVSSEVAASKGPPTETTRTHVHLGAPNISPGRLLLSAPLPWLSASLSACGPVNQNAPSFSGLPWECEQERAWRIEDRQGGGGARQRSGHPAFPGVLGMLQ